MLRNVGCVLCAAHLGTPYQAFKASETVRATGRKVYVNWQLMEEKEKLQWNMLSLDKRQLLRINFKHTCNCMHFRKVKCEMCMLDLYCENSSTRTKAVVAKYKKVCPKEAGGCL